MAVPFVFLGQVVQSCLKIPERVAVAQVSGALFVSAPEIVIEAECRGSSNPARGGKKEAGLTPPLFFWHDHSHLWRAEGRAGRFF